MQRFALSLKPVLVTQIHGQICCPLSITKSFPQLPIFTLAVMMVFLRRQRQPLNQPKLTHLRASGTGSAGLVNLRASGTSFTCGVLLVSCKYLLWLVRGVGCPVTRSGAHFPLGVSATEARTTNASKEHPFNSTQLRGQHCPTQLVLKPSCHSPSLILDVSQRLFLLDFYTRS